MLPFDLSPCIQIGIFPWAFSTTLCVFLLFLCLLHVGPMPSAMMIIIRSMWERTNYGASRCGNRWLVASCHTSVPPYCGTIRDSVPKHAAGSCSLAVAIFVVWYSQVDALFSCRWTEHFCTRVWIVFIGQTPIPVSIFPVSLRTSQATLRSLNIHVNLRRSRMTLTSDRHRDNFKTTIALHSHRCEHL
jgi:hypothetical protein